MSGKKKQLSIVATHDPDGTKLLMTYGKSAFMISLQQEDFAEFIDGLRNGFPDVKVTPAEKKHG